MMIRNDTWEMNTFSRPRASGKYYDYGCRGNPYYGYDYTWYERAEDYKAQTGYYPSKAIPNSLFNKNDFSYTQNSVSEYQQVIKQEEVKVDILKSKKLLLLQK